MKKIAAGIAATALAIGATGAEEAKKRTAPAAVYEVAPGLGHFTDDVLFGDVWLRKELAPRDRSLITVAALVSTGKIAQISGHTRRALDNGVKPEELGELITHLAFYSGWPNAISAVVEVKKVFEERKIGPLPSAEAPPLALDAVAEAARAASVERTVSPTAPELANLTNRVLFGDLWRRPELSARDRSLITMAALISMGQPEQLPFHANRAMDNGLTRSEAAEVVTHLGFYAGWPRSMSALPVLERVFAQREAAMKGQKMTEVRVIRQGEVSNGPKDYFTGEVRISSRYQGEDPARVGGATVSFAAGARTAWHTHPAGQTLFVISGRGWVQQEGKPKQEIVPGDVVWIPANVRHWHGATADSPMSHFAVAEALGGSAVTWLEQVSDDDYKRP